MTAAVRGRVMLAGASTLFVFFFHFQATTSILVPVFQMDRYADGASVGSASFGDQVKPTVRNKFLCRTCGCEGIVQHEDAQKTYAKIRKCSLCHFPGVFKCLNVHMTSEHRNSELACHKCVCMSVPVD